jgi:hypothetical protein
MKYWIRNDTETYLWQTKSLLHNVQKEQVYEGAGLYIASGISVS